MYVTGYLLQTYRIQIKVGVFFVAIGNEISNSCYANLYETCQRIDETFTLLLIIMDGPSKFTSSVSLKGRGLYSLMYFKYE